MSKLTDELKAEHAFVAKALEEVRALGIMSKEGQEKFIAVKEGLLGHLQKEDAQLYPVLNKAAESDAVLKGTLKSFTDEMNGLAGTIVGFFDKYIGADKGLEDGYLADYTKIISALKMRIDREERILYKKYDEVQG